jgi:hypothetical protein
MSDFNISSWKKNQYLDQAGLLSEATLPMPSFFYKMWEIISKDLDKQAVASGDRMSYFSAEFPTASSFERYMRRQLEGTQLNEAPGSTLNLSQDDMDKLHKDGKLEIDGHKLIFKVKESVSEGFTPSTGTVTIDGKKNVYTSSYQGTADNLEDFLKAIDRIPNTVASVKIDGQKFKASDKEGIKSKVKELTTNDTDEFTISSYYGLYKQDGDLDHPIYIDLRTPSKRQFGNDMAAGKFGPLD